MEDGGNSRFVLCACPCGRGGAGLVSVPAEWGAGANAFGWGTGRGERGALVALAGFPQAKGLFGALGVVRLGRLICSVFRDAIMRLQGACEP